MLRLTVRCPGRGMLYLATNGSQLEDGYPQQPRIVERGQQPATIELDPRGSVLALSAYTEYTKPNGRRVYAHNGATLIDIRKLAPATFNLGIDHRGIQGAGAAVEIVGIEGTLYLTPLIAGPAFDPQSYFNALQRERRPANSPLADALRAPWWAPVEMRKPLPFAAFLSSVMQVPYTERYLGQLFALGCGRFGYAPDEAQRVFEEANARGWRESREARLLTWAVLSAVPNAFQYETDYMVSASGQQQTVEIFDLLWQRRSGDCEDLGAEAHRLTRAYSRVSDSDEPGLAAFAAWLRGYVPVSLLGTVTQPAAGTGVSGHEDPSKYGGHLWFVLVARDQWEALEAGAHPQLADSMVCIEGTGIACGIPVLDKRDEKRLGALRRVVAASHGRLQSVPHEVPMTSPYFASAFYRGVIEVAYGYGEWVNRAVAVDTSHGRRGVSWEDFLSGNISLAPITVDTPDVIEASFRHMRNLVPNPTPSHMIRLPDPVPRVPGKIAATFYLPEGMAAPPLPDAWEYQHEVEQLGLGVNQSRVTFFVDE